MTPKEKAEQLIKRFSKFSWESQQNEFVKESVLNSAKQCALIAVDEILKQYLEYRGIDLQKSFDYWQQVKTEIEKL
jgi:hypothetical protein